MTQLPSAQVARLGGHNGPIHALTFSSGSQQYLLSGSADRTINLYNPSKAIETPPKFSPNTSALIQSYAGGHGYEVLSVAVSSDNARIASGGGDKTTFLWDVATAKTIRRYGGGPGGHNGRIETVCFGAQDDAVLLSGSYDASVRLWDTKAQGHKPMMVLSEAKDSISDVKIDGHEIFTGSVDGRVRVYDLRMGMIYVDVIGNPVTSLSTSGDADSFLVSSMDSTLRLLNKADGKLLQSYQADVFTNTTYRIRSTLAVKDSLAVSGSENGSVCAWDVLSGDLVASVKHYDDSQVTMKASKRVVSAVAYRKRGDYWASAGADGTIAIWATDGRA